MCLAPQLASRTEKSSMLRAAVWQGGKTSNHATPAQHAPSDPASLCDTGVWREPRPDQVHGRLKGNVYSGKHRKAHRCEQAARCLPLRWRQCCCSHHLFGACAGYPVARGATPIYLETHACPCTGGRRLRAAPGAYATAQNSEYVSSIMRVLTCRFSLVFFGESGVCVDDSDC